VDGPVEKFIATEFFHSLARLSSNPHFSKGGLIFAAWEGARRAEGVGVFGDGGDGGDGDGY